MVREDDRKVGRGALLVIKQVRRTSASR